MKEGQTSINKGMSQKWDNIINSDMNDYYSLVVAFYASTAIVNGFPNQIASSIWKTI